VNLKENTNDKKKNVYQCICYGQFLFYVILAHITPVVTFPMAYD
jgi:hypothetical protein